MPTSLFLGQPPYYLILGPGGKHRRAREQRGGQLRPPGVLPRGREPRRRGQVSPQIIVDKYNKRKDYKMYIPCLPCETFYAAGISHYN